MEIYEKVKQYIIDNEMIKEGDNIILGLSGGADSVALFRILCKLKEEIDFKLTAVHVHHGIRKKTADKDEKFVTDLCREYETELKVFHKDIPLICKITKESEEECGRRIRYEIFDEVASLYDNAKIAVAHHMNDQAETIVFRMIRGSGVKGLSGMEAKRDNIIRPLLSLKKEEIESYLTDISQKFRTDETNDDTHYSRNYIRKKILPKFEKIRDNSIDHIISLSSEASEVNAFMEKKARELLREASREANRDYIVKDSYTRYKTSVLNAAEPILRRTAIRVMIEDAGASLKDVSRNHIEQICEMLEKPGSSEIHLPKGLKVIMESGVVYLNVKMKQEKFDADTDTTSEETAKMADVEQTSSETELTASAPTGDEQAKEDNSSGLVRSAKNELGFYYEVKDNCEYALPCGITVQIRLLTEFDRESIPQDKYTKWVDYDKLADGLCLRTRKIGDYLVINSRGDEGNLKNYMINEKIPKSERDMVPLLASGAKIYWVVGHRISEDVKITDETERVLELRYLDENAEEEVECDG